jgi:hypothetical protein
MASGFEANGTDLDSVFAPFHAGWPQAGAVGYTVAGANLNGRYAPLSTGGAAGATGYRQGGTDLNGIFAALGSTGVQVGTQPGNVSGSAAAGNPSGVVTSGAATTAGAKGGGTYTYAWTVSGCTANSPNSQTTTFSATVGADTTDNASAFCTISDGVTSVNTTTIAVTLTNTSPKSSVITLVSGEAGNDRGFEQDAFGSISPTTLLAGQLVTEIIVTVSGTVTFSINGSGLTQGFIETLAISGPGVSFSMAGSAASFDGNASVGTWTWGSGGGVMVNGDTYTVTVTATP